MNLYRFVYCSRAVRLLLIPALVQLVSATGLQAQLNMDQHSIVWLGRFAGNATAIVSSDLASNLNN